MRHLPLYMVLAYSVTLPAVAAPFTYAPKGCEVGITFPEKPYIENKCVPAKDGQQDCTEIVSYTKTNVSKGSSINFRVTCRTDDKDQLATYTTAIMEETLKQMLKSQSLEPYKIQSSEENGFKKASALSIGLKGDKSDVYSGQIWIGKESIFTIESEIIGPKDDDLEKTFVETLKNTRPLNAHVTNNNKKEEKK